MYNPELAIEGVLRDEFGILPRSQRVFRRKDSEVIWHERVFDTSDPYMAARRRLSEFLHHAHVNGKLIDGRLEGYVSAYPGPNSSDDFIDELRVFISEEADRFYRDSGDVKGVMSFLSSEFVKELRGYSSVFASFVKDMLVNALEHGSNWGESGKVKMKVVMNRSALFGVIEQPLDGIPANRMQNIIKAQSDPVLLWNLHYARDLVQLRGCGSTLIASHIYPDVNFEHLPDGGFRTMILVTLEMARERECFK